MSRAPTNLQASVTRLVGRASDLQALDHAVADARLVTILGPPGVGKTRLALAFAEGRLQDSIQRFPGGVWWCDLAHAGDLEAMVATVAMTLPPSAGGSGLRGRGRTLLLLDNFEELVADGAETVARWLAEDAELGLLITSRQRLAIEGEHVLDLGPLPTVVSGGETSEAAELFLDRARRVAPRQTFGAAQLRAIEEVVTRLDGLPLAIELAAARTRILAPSQILAGLDRPDLLRGERSRTTAGRTLAGAMQTSWDALEPWERDMLGRASVFAGGFDWSAAEVVMAGGDRPRGASVLDGLERLRDRSLLSITTPRELSGEQRFAMLATVRLFATDRLAPELRTCLYEAHARHYLELFQAYWIEAPEARRHLAVERDNLVVLHERAIEANRSEDALQAAGLLASLAPEQSYGWAQRLLDEAIARHHRSDLALGRALETRGTVRRFLGRVRESLEDFEHARTIAEAAGDRALAGRAYAGLGNGSAVLARWSEGRTAFERAIDMHEADGDRVRVARIRTMIAASYYNEDRLSEADEHLDLALQGQREHGDRVFEAMSVASIGIVALARGHLSVARAHLDEARTLVRETNDRHWEGVVVGYLGTLAYEEDRLDEAKSQLELARAQLAELGVRRAEAIVLGHLATLHATRGAFDDALAAYGQALSWHRRTSPDYEGVMLAAVAAIAAMRGDLDSARAGLERAERVVAAFSRPSFATAVELYGGFLSVAHARAALDAGDEPASLAHGHRVRETLARCHESGVMTSFEARSAARQLRAAIEAVERSRRSAEAVRDPQTLVIEPSGRWFRMPHGTEVVRLDHRKPLQRVLRALVERRSSQPGEAIGVPSLLASGWPGERVLAEAGQERVYTAIATLRRLGLRPVLRRRADGYLLDPEIHMICRSAEP